MKDNILWDPEIGPVPVGWDIKKLSDIFSVQHGISITPSRRAKQANYPMLRTLNVGWRGITSENLDSSWFSEKEIKELAPEYGDLFVCEGGDIGRTAVWDKETCKIGFQNHLHRLRKKYNNVSPHFYSYWMQFSIRLRKLYINQGNKTTIPNLSQSRLMGLRVVSPPFEEQIRIAYVLSRIQDTIDIYQRSISLLSKLKKSLTSKLLTEGIEHTELKETEIGLIPEKWNIVPLTSVTENDDDIVAGPFGSNLKVIDYRDNGVPIIRLQNISPNRFLYKDIQYISLDKANELAYHSFSSGDIVMAKLGDPIGISCIVPEDLLHGIVVADVVRIRVSNNKANKWFITQILNSPICLKQFRSERTGTTRPRVNLSNVRRLKVTLPSLDEQVRIAGILNQIDNRISLEESLKTLTEDLLRSALQKLMTGLIRVKNLVMEE